MYKSEKYCKSCGQHLHLDQKFCHNCGQNSNTHRINFHFLVHEVQHGIFHVDKGIFYTIKELFTRPGHTIREYIEGRRQSHFKPVLLIMILGTVSFFLNKLIYNDNDLLINTSDLEELKKSKEYKNAMDGSKGAKLLDYFMEEIHRISNWINEHFALSVLILIPIFAFAMYLAYFTRNKSKRLNYAEFLVIATYLSAQTMVISIIAIPFREIIDSTVFLLMMFAVNLWTMIQFYKNQHPFKTVLRFLASYWIVGFIWLGIVIVLLIFGIKTLSGSGAL